MVVLIAIAVAIVAAALLFAYVMRMVDSQFRGENDRREKVDYKKGGQR